MAVCYNYPNMGCKNCSNEYPDEPPVIKNHKIVDTLEEVDYFRNAFVTVREENATYHTDSAGNAICVSRNPLFVSPEYVPTAGDYKRTVVYSTYGFYVFDADGNFTTGSLG